MVSNGVMKLFKISFYPGVLVFLSLLFGCAHSGPRSEAEGDLAASNRRVVSDFLKNVERMDYDSVLRLWSDDGVLERVNFLPGPKTDKFTMEDWTEGKANLRKLYSFLGSVRSKMKIDVIFLDSIADHPDWVVAEFVGIAENKDKSVFRMRVAAFIQVRNGKIQMIREYSGPGPRVKTAN